jgi:hypothetical protein
MNKKARMTRMARASSSLLDGWMDGWVGGHNRRWGEPQSQFGHDGEEKSLFPLPGIEHWFLSHLACSPVAIMTKLTKANLN